MQMKAADIINSISKEVKKLCSVISSNHSLKHDLSQEVLLALLEKDDEYIEDLHRRDMLLRYAFKIGWFKWNSNNGVELHAKNTSCFKAVFIDYEHIFTVDLDSLYDTEEQDYLKHITTEKDSELNAVEEVNEILDSLTTLERRVLQEYLDVNLTITNFANNSGISRSNLKARLDAIFDKIRNDRD